MLKPYHKAELQFDLVSEIGHDGQNSKTFVATDHQLNATIVVKRIDKDSLDSPANFFDESKALYASSHPNVVQVHYACYDDDYVFVAMPYYRKGSVKTLMAAGHLTVREIVTIGCQILSGLHNIHSKRLIHFDVKPDNILLSDRGEALISDFGLAKQMNFGGLAEQDRLYNKMIPPEAMTGAHQFSRTFDIYQFGLTLYRMCNGNDDFNRQFLAYATPAGIDRARFRFDVTNGRFPDRRAFGAHIPAKLRKVIRKCLETNPADRYGSAIDAANALAAIDGTEFDWRFEPTPDTRVWKKNENGTEYVFTVERSGKAECYKTVGTGQRRRFGEGCKAAMSEREVQAFLGSY